MSDNDALKLWLRLKEAGLADGELPLATESATPWYIRTMLGIAGWIGALFLLGFISAGFAFAMESAPAALAVGAMLCTVATLMFRARPNDFAAQFAFALSLAGQVLILIGLYKGLPGQTTAIALLMAGVQGALFLLIPNCLHRTWSAMIGIYAATVTLKEFGLYPYTPALLIAAHAWLWLNEFKYPERGPMVRALGYGLATVSLLTLFQSAWISSPSGLAHLSAPDTLAPWIGSGLIACVLFWTVFKLLHREGLTSDGGPARAALIAAAILALLSLKAPGIGLTVVILLTGFAQGNRVLAGLGLLGLLAYLSHYYYLLNITLLDKSMLLTASGLALLTARLAFKRLWPTCGAEENNHA